MKPIDSREASRAATYLLVGLLKFTLNVAIFGLIAHALLG